MNTGGNQTGNVGHIHHQVRTDGGCNVGKLLEVDDAGVGTSPGNDHFRLMLFSQHLQVVIVDDACIRTYTVMNKMKKASRKADRASMRQMPPMRQVHAQNGVPCFQQCKINRHVGL